MEHDTVPLGAQLEPRGPFGLLGTRILTPQQVTKKWLRAADRDGDGALSPAEFADVAPSLRVHEVIWRLARERLAHGFESVDSLGDAVE